MGFLSRREEKRDRERREAWEVAMFQLVKAVLSSIPDDAERNTQGEIAWYSDDDSLMPGFLALTNQEMVWAYADTMEVQRLDVSTGYTWANMEDLSLDGRAALAIFGKGTNAMFMFPPGSNLFHDLQVAGEDLHA